MNDVERRQWVDNDEGLMLLSVMHDGSVTDFIKKNRALIDRVVEQIKSGKRSPHYLRYG